MSQRQAYNFRNRALLKGTTSAMVILLTTAAGATAQEQKSDAVVGLEEIIVNARRVEENVQRVPIAITAVSEDALQKQDIKDLYTLTKEVPGMSICCNAGVNFFIFIRGLQGVATYFADIPASAAGFGTMFDISNVQVLKGPQGTLFGIASNGGAVVYAPKKPDEDLSGYFSAVGGNYGRRTLEGAVSIPVIEDKVLTRLSVKTSHTDGYVTDLSTGKELGDQNFYIGRFSMTLRPTENIENYTMFQYYKDSGNPTLLGVLAVVNPTGLAHQVFGPALDQALATQQALGPYRVQSLSAAANAGGPYFFNRRITLANTTTWNITENLALKNIFGFEHTRGLTVQDTDGSPLPLVDGSALSTPGSGTPVWSDEVQLQGEVFDRLNFTIGTFHTGFHTNPTVSYSSTFGALSAQITKNAKLSRAVYGQGTYSLDDYIEGLSLTAGYRYTWDSINQSNSRLTLPTLVSNRDLARKVHFASGSWTAGLQYQLTAEDMLFFTASKGYSAGGVALTAPAQFQTFQPESLTNLEAGVKSTFTMGDVQVRANVSGFYGFYDDVQVSVVSAVQVNPPPAPRSLMTVTQNAATARIKGIEADITIVPTDNFEFAATAGYTDNNYTDYPTLDALGNPVDFSSSPFLQTSKLKYTLRGTYHLPLDRAAIGDVSITANYYHRSKFYTQVKPLSQIVPANINPAHHNLDMSVDWRDVMGHAGLAASVFVTNVTKNLISDSQLAAYDSLGILSVAPAVPRQFGIRLRYDF